MMAAMAILALSLLTRPMPGCDLMPRDRPEALEAYVGLAAACLAAPPEPARFDVMAETEFARLINAERAGAGLPALQMRPDLVPATRFHSLDLAWNGLGGHIGAGGRNATERIAALDRRLVRQAARENVARASGQFDPSDIPAILHAGLMDSPGHRANILADDVTHMAIGVARVDDVFVVTQKFVAVSGEFAGPVPLRVSLAELGALNVRLDDWRVRRLALLGRDGKLLDPPIADRALVGAVRLLVRGEDRPANERSFRFIYLHGPDVTVSDVAAPRAGDAS